MKFGEDFLVSLVGSRVLLWMDSVVGWCGSESVDLLIFDFFFNSKFFFLKNFFFLLSFFQEKNKFFKNQS